MRLSKQHFIGLAHRVAYAALISALVWALVLSPSDAMLADPYGPSTWLVRLVDLPIAVATQALPCDEFALDLWFTIRGERACPGVPEREAFFQHMRVGIPVYVFLFYVPNILIGAARWWRGRASSKPAPGR